MHSPRRVLLLKLEAGSHQKLHSKIVCLVGSDSNLRAPCLQGNRALSYPVPRERRVSLQFLKTRPIFAISASVLILRQSVGSSSPVIGTNLLLGVSDLFRRGCKQDCDVWVEANDHNLLNFPRIPGQIPEYFRSITLNDHSSPFLHAGARMCEATIHTMTGRQPYRYRVKTQIFRNTAMLSISIADNQSATKERLLQLF